MRRELLEYVACPKCGGSLELEAPRMAGEEIMAGHLRCAGCGATYVVVRGVPRLSREMDELADTAKAFSREWSAHHGGTLEHDTLYGRTEEEDWAFFKDGTGLDDEDLEGMVVLDAGCGAGRLTRQIADRGVKAVVALDMSETVDAVFNRYRSVPNFHVVQGNILRAPVKTHAFDLVWSCGVIHHTPDAPGAFAELARRVRPGGTLFVWVYAKRFNPFRWTKAGLDRIGLRRLSDRTIMRLSRLLAYPSIVTLEAYRLLRRIPGLGPRGPWAVRTLRPRGLKEVQLTWNDALAPPYNSWHTEAEVMAWFRKAGFENMVPVVEPKVGVRGTAAQASAAGGRRRVAFPS
jgi:SAM-dependent methyltransferase